MRFVPLLIFLVIAGLALPVLIAAECSDQAISVSEAGDYNLFEQIDFDEELNMPNVGVNTQYGVLGVTGRFCTLRFLPERTTSDKLLTILIIRSTEAVNF